jgi:RNA polymerase sigma-70 factor, ECF subfamily
VENNDARLLHTATDALLGSIRRGDSRALDALLAKAGGRVMALIALRMSSRLKARLDPEDVLQEVYMEAVRSLGSFQDRGPGSFYAWFATLALRTLNDLEDHVRAERRDPAKEIRLDRAAHDTTLAPRADLAIAATQSSASSVVVRWEMFDSVRAAFELLSPTERDVIVMRYLQGLSSHETAKVLELDVERVYVALSRGLAKIRGVLGEL